MVKGLWYYQLALIHKLLLSNLKMHGIRTAMQDRLGPDPDGYRDLNVPSTSKCDLKANLSGNEGAFTSLWWVLAGCKANETQALQVLLQFRDTVGLQR